MIDFLKGTIVSFVLVYGLMILVSLMICFMMWESPLLAADVVFGWAIFRGMAMISLILGTVYYFEEKTMRKYNG